MADSIERFVALTPVFIPDLPFTLDDAIAVTAGVALTGIDSVYGPDWDSTYALICSSFGQEVCDYYAGDSMADSVQNQLHFFYNAVTGRFQEFAPNFIVRQIVEEVPLHNIDKVPVTVFYAEHDSIGQKEDQMPFVARLRSEVKEVTIEGWTL